MPHHVNPPAFIGLKPVIIAYRAANLTDAHIVAGLLESHGISSHVGGHFLQGGVGDLAPTDLAQVYVEEQDFEAAMEHIDAYTSEQTTLEAPSIAQHSNKTLLLLLGFALIVGLSYAIAW
ncbi:MAG: DUF2007 domain-containing protein [Granulosicoccaceae bacterium]